MLERENPGLHAGSAKHPEVSQASTPAFRIQQHYSILHVWVIAKL
jgi:hypothetical protein